MSFLPRTIGDSIALRDTIAAGTMAGLCAQLGQGSTMQQGGTEPDHFFSRYLLFREIHSRWTQSMTKNKQIKMDE